MEPEPLLHLLFSVRVMLFLLPLVPLEAALPDFLVGVSGSNIY